MKYNTVFWLLFVFKIYLKDKTILYSYNNDNSDY